MIVFGCREDKEQMCDSSYLQPNLEKFIFGGAVLSEYSIGLLESRFPRLRAIDIHVLSDSINSGRLLRFFEMCNSLTRIYIDWSTNHPIDDHVLAHLAGRDGQLGFGTQSPIKYSTISKAFKIIPSPFKDIHTWT